jgi:hypothetical protein
MKTLLNVGDIFSKQSMHGGPLTYWKVTSVDEKGWQHLWTYHVIRCTKTGKEFKDVNGFSTDIDRYFRQEKGSEFNIVKRATEVGTKANIDKGIESGKVKRRIQYLENKIDRYSKELERLKLGLSN